ncbi:MAG: hypothetical protein OXE40_05680, partial [Gammaproteobacteria bacterium]|nr:hypothetical protein [Gammaproteobacteria bacterium]
EAEPDPNRPGSFGSRAVGVLRRSSPRPAGHAATEEQNDETASPLADRSALNTGNRELRGRHRSRSDQPDDPL